MKVVAQRYSLKLVKEVNSPYKLNVKVDSPYAAYKAFIDILKLDQQAEEVFGILTLDAKTKITGVLEVARGSISEALVSPREVFKRAILNNSKAIILGHNHPSGDVSISRQDIKTTEKLVEAGKILGIQIFDHIVVGDSEYSSLKEKGHM